MIYMPIQIKMGYKWGCFSNPNKLDGVLTVFQQHIKQASPEKRDACKAHYLYKFQSLN
ncbi:hypothetical protein HanPSC8_Chr04g0175281 [Helianthus annuus]|nr:hypothetical protein HanPSC8_Chr04g0175281 [Helianthus annuus]